MGHNSVLLFISELFGKHGDILFMAIINNSIHTSAVRSSSGDRRALTSQGRPPGEQCLNKEVVAQACTRKYYIGMCRIPRTATIHALDLYNKV